MPRTPNDTTAMRVLWTPKDLETRNAWKKIKVREGLTFTAAEIRQPSLVHTPMGSSRKDLHDYIVVLSDGCMYAFDKKAYRLIFEEVSDETSSEV
jgi:hypothetical protein